MIYLNFAALSPTLLQVEQEVEKTLSEFKEHLYSDAGIQWYRAKVQECRETVRDLFQISDQSFIAFLPNASTANYMLLSLIAWRPGDIILSTTHENPSIRNELLALQHRGVVTHFLQPTSSPQQFLSSVQHAMQNQKIRAILLSHVSHVDGRIFPIAEIADLARERNILCIVDGAQAVGQIAVNIERINCDAYFFSGYKWCGGPLGTGGLIISARLLEQVPSIRSTSISGEQVPASRFEIGTQNIGLIAGLAKACMIKKQEGFNTESLKKIREQVKNQLKEIKEIQTKEWSGPHGPGILTFSHQAHDSLMKIIQKKQIVVKQFKDYPEGETPAIRLSWDSTIESKKLTFALDTIRQ